MSPELGLVWQDTPVGRVYALYRHQKRVNVAWMDMVTIYKALCKSWLTCYMENIEKDKPIIDKMQQYLREIGV